MEGVVPWSPVIPVEVVPNLAGGDSPTLGMENQLIKGILWNWLRGR